MPLPEFVAFDLETTGLSAKTDRIIEVGAVRFDAAGHRLGDLDLLVDPGMPIPIAIQRLVGLRDSDVKGGPTPPEAVAHLAEFADDAHLVAHGAAFDIAYCSAELPDVFARRLVFDTLELARILLPLAPSHSLPLLTKALGISHDHPHRADSDADATRALFIHLAAVAAGLPRALLADLRDRSVVAGGSLQEFFTHVVDGDGDALAAPLLGGVAAPPRPLREKRTLDLAAESIAIVGPDGPLAGDDYEYREQQIAMTQAVAQTIERGGRLLVEAGTGVGKSYAYIAPLLLNALAGNGRSVIATHTITLQEQLVNRDIPRVNEALPEPARVAMLKGRHHYVSLRRWSRFLTQPAHDIETLRFQMKILVWLSQTTTGDRSDLRLSGPEPELWRRIESDAGDCLGSACSNWRGARCFMVAARRAAAEADLVVTNHALLVADSERQGTVLESHAALVVDEGHRLEESATGLLGTSLKAQDIRSVLERVDVTDGSALAALVDDADAAVVRLFGDVKGTVSARLGNDGAANGTIAWDVKENAAPVLVSSARVAVASLETLARSLVAEGRDDVALRTADTDSEAALAADSLLDAATALRNVILDARDGRVAWLELRAEQGEVHDAPISVAAALNTRIFEKSAATIITSATLSVGSDFGFVRNRLGIGGGAETLALDSPFDYLSQALSIIPTDVPPYDDPHYDEALAALIAGIARRLEGRTLALFTGYAPLRRVHGLLDRKLASDRIAVLGQGLDGTRGQVLASFLANPRTVLLGTSSFWEGVDIPGDALRCVVIAKLPFAVPTDPLVRARCDTMSDPFRGYILPAAVLRLKQGFGRLIRRSDDHGAVVIGDARLGSHDYARAFLEALPPALVARLPVGDIAAAVSAFVATGEIPVGAGRLAFDGHDTPQSRDQAVEDGLDAPHSEEPA